MNRDSIHKEPSERVGEVVESATSRFTAQCYRLYDAPPLGALVRTHLTPTSPGEQPSSSVEQTNSYAIVYSISTQSLDPGRPIFARGEEEEREEDVYRSNPQLSRLLCTRFEALIVGHGDGEEINYSLPPLPPRIYAFVYQCAAESVKAFTDSLHFVHNLVTSGLPSVDEVIAACLRQASVHHEDPQGFIIQAGRALATELSGELQRLNAIVRRLSS